jgi:histidine triad (HIT) family protein
MLYHESRITKSNPFFAVLKIRVIISLYFIYPYFEIMFDPNNIFCRIIRGEIPAKFVYQDDLCVAFHDLYPQAPVHVLVIPRDGFVSLNEAEEDKHKEVLGHLLLTAAKIARDLGIAESGYRTIINTGADAGQSVFHLHVHLLGGRPFGWGND